MRVAAMLVVAMLTGAADAQAPSVAATPQVTFQFERPGLPVPRFTLTIDRGGSGTYVGEEAVPMGRGATGPPVSQPFERTVAISAATAEKIVALARGAKRFNTNCETKVKNLANTGKKTLSYAGPDGAGSCVYNYSDIKDVQQLTALFQGIAETMDMGRQLDHLRRYDRLGLDAELGTLANEIAEGRALELVTIQASLRSVVQDTDLMQRARSRANAMLASLPAEAAQVGPNQR